MSDLIDRSLLRRLELITLNSNRNLKASETGDRRSRRRGLSIEFSDFREYFPGDDLRYVDWKAYGRLEKLFLKLFQDEEDLNLHLLIDSSMSMSFGEPTSKWGYARRAAAAIGFLALHDNHRVDVSSYSSHVATRIAPLRGGSALPSFIRSLESMSPPNGETNFSQVVRQYSATAPPAGIVIVFSDFYDSSLSDGLTALASRNHDITLVQVLTPEELTPEIYGDYSLTDSETGLTHDVTLSDDDLSEYAKRIDSHKQELQSLTKRLGVSLLQVRTDDPLDNLVLGALRKVGVVK